MIFQYRRGLTVKQYRTRCNLPRDHPMTAPRYSVQRSSFAKQIGLGEFAERSSHQSRRAYSKHSQTSASQQSDCQCATEGDGFNLEAIIVNLEGRSYL
jgi:hypothetical protein